MHRTNSYGTPLRRFAAIAAQFVAPGLALGAIALTGCSSDTGTSPGGGKDNVGAGTTTTPTGTMPTDTTGGTTSTPTAAPTDTTVPGTTTTGTTAPTGAGTGVGEEDPVFVDEPGTDTTVPSGGFLPSEKVDMLFVIDNSSSMGDKQAVFRRAIPDMIDQMVNPPCVAKDEAMKQVFVEKNADGTCPDPATPIFKPVKDIHIGVVSSSLGPRGLLDTEMPPEFNCDDQPGHNDKAWMIGRARTEINADSYQGYGFLVWDQAQKANPVGDNMLPTLLAKFDTQIGTVGEAGCGFEAPLEAAYRFLIEPDPYASVVRGPCPGQTDGTLCAIPDGLDQDLLDQRKAFLRPDSVVVVLYLTDENDCSIKTRGQGYLAMSTGQLDNGTLACETDPNGACCLPCGVTPDPALGCPTDPAMNGCDRPAGDANEAANVRCFEQQKRFGVSLLRSTTVYVGGFVFPKVQDRAGMAQDNPLFTEFRGRDKIFVVGIIGTPWQDTATAETLGAADKGQLDLIEASKVDWGKYVPTAANAAPTDPFNVESLVARTGTQPLTQEAMGGVGTWNTINGHERALASLDNFDDDLQYACIFELPEPRDCAAAGADTYCDCAAPGPDDVGVLGPEGNPLCWDGTQYSTTQYYAKAYPGPRMLEVLHGVACPPDPETGMATECTDQAVVSSICPRQVTDNKKLDYGYRPVIRALLLNVSTKLVR